MPAIGIHEPDGRKPIRNENGDLVRTMCMWEVGLFLDAAACALRSGQVRDETRLHRVMVTLCLMMARYGFFVREGQTYIVQDIEWRDGEHVPIETARNLGTDGWRVAVFGADAGDVRSWTMLGIIVAADVLRDLAPFEAQACRQCMATFGVDLKSPNTQRDAEWFACVEPFAVP